VVIPNNKESKGEVMKLGKKIIGIIGGMGPEATADLFYRIIKTTKVKKDQDHFHIIINSNPKIPDRTPAILGNGPSPLPLMIETGKTLESVGADFLVMPCNTAHFFHEELQNQLRIPLLHMIKLSAKYVAEKYPRVKESGLLATDGTLTSKLYHDAFDEFEINTITPSISSQSIVMDAIYKYIKTGNLEKGGVLLQDIANELIENGANAIICGCTEVSLVLQDGDLAVPIIDPLQILAHEAIKLALS
jgi:aspartate racemase